MPDSPYLIENETTASLQGLDLLRRLKKDYSDVFLSPAGQRVLQDLAKVCRANKTCFHPDPRIHAMLEGRRELWLYVQQNLNLTPQQLFELYAGRTIMEHEDG